MRNFLHRALPLLLAVMLAAGAAAPAFAAGPETAAGTKGNGSPYYLLVNRKGNTTTVYGLDAYGYYSIPVRAMVCSTGKPGCDTPPGTFTISNRAAWMYMADGTYGQYATRFNGAILFHSICYAKKDPSTVLTYEYNMLGGPASLGCVRLQVADAKWVFDNCPKGTKVTIYDSDIPGPLGKPDTLVSEISDAQANGWDPSDPRTDNPWRDILGEKAGTSSALAGMPFLDVRVTDWFYPQVLGMYRDGLMKGTSAAAFDPNEPLTYAQALQLVCNLQDDTPSAPEEGPWYAPAVSWAKSAGISRPEDGEFDPDAPIPRQMFALYLCRLAGGTAEDADAALAVYTDAGRISENCREALAWASGQGIMSGYNGSIMPHGALTRAQAASMLTQFKAL